VYAKALMVHPPLQAKFAVLQSTNYEAENTSRFEVLRA